MLSATTTVVSRLHIGQLFIRCILLLPYVQCLPIILYVPLNPVLMCITIFNCNVTFPLLSWDNQHLQERLLLGYGQRSISCVMVS